jgi:hypothetical protein
MLYEISQITITIALLILIVVLLSYTPHSTQYTHYRPKYILPLHSNNFNDIFLLIISTKPATLARFHRMLPDDGPIGPKHVGAI